MQLSPASSWAAPRQKGAVPPRSAILTECMGIRNHPKSSPQLAHQATKGKMKEISFETGKETSSKTRNLERPDYADWHF